MLKCLNESLPIRKSVDKKNFLRQTYTKIVKVVIREIYPRERDFDKYLELRWKILRKPWDQPRGSEVDELDDKAIHIAAYDGDKIVGVARLHFNSKEEAQIRYMAVDEGYRNKGIGSKMLEKLEKIAKEEGARYVILNARENAVGFYLKNRYELIEKSYLLFGRIQHYKMRKTL